MATGKKNSGSPKVKKMPVKLSGKTKPANVLPAASDEYENFYVVGMGASAGGLEAFETFFKNMPADSNMAFVLVPHLDPDHASIMPRLIQKHTKLDVREVKDGTRVKPNAVYIVPPKHNLAILQGSLQLLEPSEHKSLKMPIDFFFRSLAQDMKKRAIGIILSGMGSDGTIGLRAIKSELGMSMVQDPQTAKYNYMPNNAIHTGLVDFILPVEKMPQQLIQYTQHSENIIALKLAPKDGQIPDAMQKIFILLRNQTGHDFSLYKPTTLCRRIERRMNIHQISDILNYIRYLQQTPQEITSLFKELLIGVTNFFRDPEAFEVLKKRVLSKIITAKADNTYLRIWVPGCSTGEEAYSIAILVQECLIEAGRNLKVQIFATDIDEDAVTQARNGTYPDSILADVTADRLNRFFLKDNGFCIIKENIREMLVFAVQDIIQDPPFTKLDLICCRNLLIYLESVLQKKLVPLFHYSLVEQGFLFLGSSETIGDFHDLFEVEHKKWKIFKRKKLSSSRHRAIEFPIMTPPLPNPEINFRQSKQTSVPQLAERILLQSYAPPSAIINEQGDILYIHGRTGKYLEPSQGEANLNIFEMAREGLKPELLIAVRQVLAQHQEIVHESLSVKDNGDFSTVNLTVKPMKQTGDMPGLLMVVFEEVTSGPHKKPPKARDVGKKKRDQKIEVIEQELQYTKENLQITIEELETSNEELKSTNEELQSTNEELQSANEELETSQEEQQSLNEELVTVNSELQGKIDELTTTNNDMHNLLNSLEIPTIFLDIDLNIKRFTAGAARIINVIKSDIGRPLSHIASNLKYTKLTEDARAVLRNLAYKELEVQTKKDRWYLIRILPYRTIENVIDGVVIIFVDIHAQKTATEKIKMLNLGLQDACEYAENIIATIREPLLVLGQELKVISANSSFYKMFQVNPAATVDKYIYELGNRQWDIPQLRELLEKIIPENTVIEDFQVEHEFLSIGFKKMLLNARKINRKKDADLILIAIEDITGSSAKMDYPEKIT